MLTWWLGGVPSRSELVTVTARPVEVAICMCDDETNAAVVTIAVTVKNVSSSTVAIYRKPVVWRFALAATSEDASRDRWEFGPVSMEYNEIRIGDEPELKRDDMVFLGRKSATTVNGTVTIPVNRSAESNAGVRPGRQYLVITADSLPFDEETEAELSHRLPKTVVIWDETFVTQPLEVLIPESHTQRRCF